MTITIGVFLHVGGPCLPIALPSGEIDQGEGRVEALQALGLSPCIRMFLPGGQGKRWNPFDGLNDRHTPSLLPKGEEGFETASNQDPRAESWASG